MFASKGPCEEFWSFFPHILMIYPKSSSSMIVWLYSLDLQIVAHTYLCLTSKISSFVVFSICKLLHTFKSWMEDGILPRIKIRSWVKARGWRSQKASYGLNFFTVEIWVYDLYFFSSTFTSLWVVILLFRGAWRRLCVSWYNEFNGSSP